MQWGTTLGGHRGSVAAQQLFLLGVGDVRGKAVGQRMMPKASGIQSHEASGKSPSGSSGL